MLFYTSSRKINKAGRKLGYLAALPLAQAGAEI
jgi:hypothetical protein